MSDQSFGKAARDEWDSRELVWQDQRRVEIRDAIDVSTELTPGGWCAVDDRAYDGPGSPMGWGSTEHEAIKDLIEQLLERA